MDWTFLLLSAGVVALAAVVIPLTTRNILTDVIVRISIVGAGLLVALYFEGPTWPLYRLLIGFLFALSVWILIRRSDSSAGGPGRRP